LSSYSIQWTSAPEKESDFLATVHGNLASALAREISRHLSKFELPECSSRYVESDVVTKPRQIFTMGALDHQKAVVGHEV
jgi:hypothetical protein